MKSPVILMSEGETLIIIAISTFITLVTALSMSAISTNGEIGGGIKFHSIYSKRFIRNLIKLFIQVALISSCELPL